MIIIFLLNAIVLLSASFITLRIFKFSDIGDSLLALGIVYLAQIIISQLILGITGRLYLAEAILLNTLIFLFIWLVTYRRKAGVIFRQQFRQPPSLLSNRVILLLSAIILGFGVVKVLFNLFNPPFGWDSLNYHFTFAVEWLKNGNLDIPITIGDDPSPSYYPLNGSLYFLWLMLPLKNVFLADLGQLPFFVLSFLALYNIARRLKLDEQLAFYCAAIFILIPNFFKQLQVAYVDVMVAGLFFTGLNFLFALKEKFSCQNVLIYSMTIGLLIGTKTLALPYSFLLLLPFLYLSFKNIRRGYLFFILVPAVVILGGFSYLRHFFLTHNPFYPLHLELFGRVIFKGTMESAVFGAHFNLQDYRLGKILFHEGLGLQTLIFVLPAFFLAFPVACLRNKPRPGLFMSYFFLLPVLLYLVYRYVIPLANTRYLYPLLGVGMLAGFYTLNILRVPAKVIALLVAVCALASFPELAKRQELIIATIVSMALLFLLRRLFKLASLIVKRSSLVILLCLGIIAGLAGLNKDYNRQEYSRYIKMVKYSGFWPDAVLAWDWLNTHTDGNNIAYVGRPVPFPLYGTNFKNNVYYVSINSVDPVKLHYFPGSRYRWGYDFLSLHKNLEEPGNYREKADYLVWLNNLLRRSTEYLFVYSLHQTKEGIFPLEDNWAKENPAKFSPVFINDTIHIYRVN